MIDLVTILTLLAPILVATVLYGLCVRILRVHGRERAAVEIAAERREATTTSVAGREAPTVADSRQVA